MVCVKCNSIIPEGVDTCPRCGQKYTMPQPINVENRVLCPRCKNSIPAFAPQCNFCGAQFGQIQQPYTNASFGYIPIAPANYRGKWSVGRLTMGIISLVASLLILFQSCAVGVYNTLARTGESSGAVGVVFILFLLVSGIVGITTRNSHSKAGAITAGCLYLFAAFIAFVGGGQFVDLKYVWSLVACVFGVMFIIAGAMNNPIQN